MGAGEASPHRVTPHDLPFPHPRTLDIQKNKTPLSKDNSSKSTCVQHLEMHPPPVPRLHSLHSAIRVSHADFSLCSVIFTASPSNGTLLLSPNPTATAG